MLDPAAASLTTGPASMSRTIRGVRLSSRIMPAARASRGGDWCEAFLVGERGRRLRAGTARSMFVRMSRAIGLRATTEDGRDGYGPRLQDFRHSFATGRLVEWYRAGLDMTRELPKLAAYLGHVDVGLTYWYIEAVPELLQLAAGYLYRDCSGELP